MNSDFHYYATYCAAILAGYNHRDSLDIAYSNCFVDMCTKTMLSRIKAPLAAATTQLNLVCRRICTPSLPQSTAQSVTKTSTA